MRVFHRIVRNSLSYMTLKNLYKTLKDSETKQFLSDLRPLFVILNKMRKCLFISGLCFCGALSSCFHSLIAALLGCHSSPFGLQKQPFYHVKVYIESEIGKNAAIALSINDLKGLLEAA